MKFKTIHLLLLSLLVWACTKPDKTPKTVTPDPKDTTQIKDTTKPKDSTQHPVDSFITYLILKGNNYCEKNSYPLYKQASLSFIALFDSSCIYTTLDPNNQADINKLMGFSDCTTLHHANSARFGWNWKDDKLQLHAYCYVDSVRQYKKLGDVALNTPIQCKLEVLPGMYVFTLDGKKDTMQRFCNDSIANGIKLYPYFGGDEPAPHDIRIKVKELP